MVPICIEYAVPVCVVACYCTYTCTRVGRRGLVLQHWDTRGCLGVVVQWWWVTTRGETVRSGVEEGGTRQVGECGAKSENEPASYGKPRQAMAGKKEREPPPGPHALLMRSWLPCGLWVPGTQDVEVELVFQGRFVLAVRNAHRLALPRKKQLSSPLVVVGKIAVCFKPTAA